MRKRLGDMGVRGFWDVVEPLIHDAPDPERAVGNLERWLLSGSSPEIRAASLRDNPALAQRLVFVLGAAQSVADALIQNSEMAITLSDATEVASPIRREAIISEASSLLSKARSFSHRLDRLRYLKQKAMLKVLWNDLSSTWEPEMVWLSLSELADGLLESTFQVVWDEVGTGEAPVAVIALGKHGSKELNYSSDVDLVFVMSDEISDARGVGVFCEKFIRAVTAKMGRGSLYRVDMRLRPFGRVGVLVHRLSAITKYLRNYAEPWEVQALTRARPCAGHRALGSEFMEVADAVVYRGPRSEVFLAELVAAKQRSERETAAGVQDNVKLAPGGIRDIEFLVQLLQVVTGDRFLELRHVPTLSAISMLGARKLLDERSREVLSAAYRLFRQIEHRIQAVYDLQSHTLPQRAEEGEVLARLMGSFTWKDLCAEVRRRRNEVRTILEERVPGLKDWRPERIDVGHLLRLKSDSRSSQGLQVLLGGFESQEAFLSEVLQHEAIRERLRLILRLAPRVVSEIAFHRELWDVAFSDVVELRADEERDPGDEITARLSQTKGSWEAEAGACARWLYVVAALKHAFHGNVERTFSFLTQGVSALLLSVLDKLGGEGLDVVALGRLGSGELLLGSDWDVILLSPRADGRAAERIGEELMRAARRLSIGSSHFPLDPRLRPEGRSGLLVRSQDALLEYSRTSMEAWERIAFTRARSLRGLRASEETVALATFGRAWTCADEESALQLKKRVHVERSDVTEGERDLKLGDGSLFDIEWLVGVLKLRIGEVCANRPSIVESIGMIKQEGVLSESQANDLTAAYLFFSELRNRMYLLDLGSDCVMPSEQELLNRLAESFGYTSEVLVDRVRMHQHHVRATLAGVELS